MASHDVTCSAFFVEAKRHGLSACDILWKRSVMSYIDVACVAVFVEAKSHGLIDVTCVAFFLEAKCHGLS